MDYSDLRILAFRADDAGCGSYRISHPLTVLQRRGADVTNLNYCSRGFHVEPDDLRGYDFIIIQRCQLSPFVELARAAKDPGAVLIYEMDDSYHRVDPESQLYQIYRPGSETLRGIERCLRMSDAVIASTPELASHYANFHDRIVVLPNLIDFTIRDWETPVPRPPELAGKRVIGWCGGSFHQGDYEPLRGVLRDTLLRYDHVVFAICSLRAMAEEFCQRLELPDDRVVFLDTVSFDRYPTVPAQFDIGLAPLRESAFNRAKSDLRLKEYGARGVPYVASRIAPYQRFHQETGGCGGYLAACSQDWREALTRLIESDEDRSHKSEAIRRAVRTSYNLDDHADQWLAAFRTLREARPATAWTSRERPGRNDPCPCTSGRKYKKCCTPAFG